MKLNQGSTAGMALISTALFCATSFAANVWSLPFRAEDLHDAERIVRIRKIHSSGGPQKYGYDLGVERYVGGKWSEFSGSGKKNSDWHIYGAKVRAMAPGTVIACWRNAPENPPGSLHQEITKYTGNKSRIYGGGNGFWIQHADGSIAEYAHFRPGSVPASLCPHNAQLMPGLIDSPDVVHAWKYIRVTKGAKVAKGQVLGRAGNAGTSSNPHLHIHREKGGTYATTFSKGASVKMNFARGLYVARTNRKGPYQTGWTRLAGKPIPAGPVHVWPPRGVGREYARHGFPAARYGAFFEHLSDSGFLPVIVDAYSVAGKTYINHVWNPAKGRRFYGYHLLSASRYQSKFTAATKAGYHPIWVDSVNANGQARYSAVFVKGAPAGYARHGLSSSGLTALIQHAKKRGLRPAQVSAVSIGGKLQYTALANKTNIGNDWVVKPHISEASYQAVYNAQKKAGRAPFYAQGYVHGGKRYLTVVFSNGRVKSRVDRHGLSASGYQNEYTSSLKAGRKTLAVSGYDGNSAHRFVASWVQSSQIAKFKAKRVLRRRR